LSDAIARASEVGVLTNQDIARYRTQVLFEPGDTDKLKQEKLNRAIAWGEWLASNQEAINKGDYRNITSPPGRPSTAGSSQIPSQTRKWPGG